jgi:23S rRNA (adenine2503-C2)-methyltransferase
MSQRPHIFDLNPDRLRELVEGAGLAPYRAAQVLDWVYRKRVLDPELMSNLARADRRWLAEKVRFETGRVVRQQAASDGVQKLLIQWEDGDDTGTAKPQDRNHSLPVVARQREPGPERQTECVMIPVDDTPDRSLTDVLPHSRSDLEKGATGRPSSDDPCSYDPKHGSAQTPARGTRPPETPDRSADRAPVRRTACISSQIGCPVGCRFCASGLGGLDGNLSAGQIVEQVWRLSTLDGVERITHVVFMGMGEPLANFEAVVGAAQTLCAPWGMGISARKITVSTVGLPAQIRRLAQVGLPLTLAISLHAPNDALRRELIPWARYVTIAEILAAGQEYFDQTGREITLEYILLRGVNDRPEHARELVEAARQLRGNVNLIRYNPVDGMPYQRPIDRDVLRFQEILRRAGVNTHIRASRGKDIAAACGQLRHENRGARVAP